jgi:small conductance mechanosensitive channel
MKALFDELDVSHLTTRVVEYLPAVIAAVAIMLAFWLVYRIVSTPMRKLLSRVGFQPALTTMLVDNIFRLALFLFATVMALGQLGINVGAALAGIGVAGLAIGLAAQDSLANIIAGFLIFWDKPFVVGDWLTVAGQYGAVTDITMRSTRIRTNNNTFVVIPNKKIIDEVLVNHSKHGETRVDVPIGIAYKEEIARARAAILESLAQEPRIASVPAPAVVVTELGASSVNMEVRVWIHEAGDEAPVFVAVMEASKLALDRAGIEIPYHHLQLFVEDVNPRLVQQVVELAGVRRA